MSRGWFVFRTERLRFELNEGSECGMRGTRTIAAAAVVFLAACVGPPGAAGGRFGPPGGLEPSQPRYINPGTLAALPGFTHAVRAGATRYSSGAGGTALPISIPGTSAAGQPIAHAPSGVYDSISTRSRHSISTRSRQ